MWVLCENIAYWMDNEPSEALLIAERVIYQSNEHVIIWLVSVFGLSQKHTDYHLPSIKIIGPQPGQCTTSQRPDSN